MDEIKKPILVCSECKGENILYKVWYNPNTDKIHDSASDGDIEDNWCLDCNKHVNFDLNES